MKTTRYYRIQPAGLPLVGHRSESSDGIRDGVDVFESADRTFRTDAPRKFYGDEVLVIEASEDWPNGDVEGVRIDPATATIVERVSWADWRARHGGRAGRCDD
jgi:hypothetical protein